MQPGLDLPIRSQQPFSQAAYPASATAPDAPSTHDAGEPPATAAGYPQRIPGAALASGGALPASAPTSADPHRPLPGTDPLGGPLSGDDSRNPSSGADPLRGPLPGGDPLRGSLPGADPARGALSGSGQHGSDDRGPGSSADPLGASSAVPQPRDPGNKPAVGSARPVTASASVPGRVTPAEVAELPPPIAAPQARVYGRPAPVTPEDEPEGSTSSDEAPSGGFAATSFPPVPAAPSGDFTQAPQSDSQSGGFGFPERGDNSFGSPRPGENLPGGSGLPRRGDDFGVSQQDENHSGGFGLESQSGGFGLPQRGNSNFAPPQQDEPGGSRLPQRGDGFGGPQHGENQPGDSGLPQRGDGFGGPQHGEYQPGGFGLPQRGDGDFGMPEQGGNGFGPGVQGVNGFAQEESPSGGHHRSQLSDNEFDLPRRGADERGGLNGPDDEPPSGGFAVPERRDGAPSGFGTGPFSGAPFDGDPSNPGGRSFSGTPHDEDHHGFGAFPAPADGAPGVSGLAPQSPARASARATASARVSPPEVPGGGSPFAVPGSPEFQAGTPGVAPFTGAGASAMPGSPQHFPGAGASAMPGSPQQFPGAVQQPFGLSGDPSGSSPFGPPPGDLSGPPYNEFTSDLAGRGGAPSTYPEHFSEHTTDVSGRGDSTYVPAPALPPMPGEQPGGALYPHSPAARATVTPPGPEDTTSWPGPGDDQGKFEKFSAPEPAAAAPVKAHVRTVPVALAVVLGAALLLGMVFGLVYLISGDDDFKVAQGQCVKRNGSTPVVAACTEADTFQVVSIVKAKGDCGDATQPYIVIPKNNEVLCLKKNG